MHLTKHQRNRLVSYWMFHRKPPTLSDVLKRIAPLLAVLGFLCLLLVWGAFDEDPFVSRVFLVGLGFVIGGATHAVLLARMSVHMWPLMEQVINWERLESLMREHAPDLHGVLSGD